MVSGISFEERKLCATVIGKWYKHRINIAKFFAKNHPNDLDCYGADNKILGTMYKGKIPGFFYSKEKIDTLINYRFSICFENKTNLNGYISEKIFACFEGGCIPIYWGAMNIEKYIPKSCFIDYRDFATDEDLYQFICTMPKEKYQEYVDEIKRYLQSEEAKIFSPEFFDNIIYKAITDDS